MNSPPFATKGLSIERLVAFCAVVEHGSVTVAADHDPTRQSQFSRQIKELEDCFGIPLFQRINRRLVPTEAGRALALMTRGYFDGMKELCRGAATDAEALGIAAAESILEGLVYPRFTRMRELLPRYHFDFQGAPTDEVVKRLNSGRSDLGIVRESAVTADFFTVPLTEIAYCLTVPRELLPEGSAHGLATIRGLPLALLRGDGEFTRALLSLCQEEQINPQPTVEASTFAGLRELVKTGSVAAFLPQWMGRGFPQDRFAIVGGEEFNCLSRKVVVAAPRHTLSVRPKLEDVVELLATIWRP